MNLKQAIDDCVKAVEGFGPGLPDVEILMLDLNQTRELLETVEADKDFPRRDHAIADLKDRMQSLKRAIRLEKRAGL